MRSIVRLNFIMLSPCALHCLAHVLCFTTCQVTVHETESHRQARNKRISDIGDATYNAERDYRQKVHDREMVKARLLPGSLCTLLVKGTLKVARAPAGCNSIPVVVQNVFADGNMYEVKGKCALIKEWVHRRDLILVINDTLKNEIEHTPLSSVESIPLEQYLKTYWVPPSTAPACKCTGGCKKRSKCPCRLAGYRCGSYCHPSYYKRCATCANYK